jgi:rhodanese-related sulfurtransferase
MGQPFHLVEGDSMQVLRSLVVGSMWILAALLVPAGVSAQASGPRYAEVYDIGEVSADSQVRHVFTVANNSDAWIRIERAHASCDCVQILAYPESIPPRKKGQFEVRLIPAETGAVACEVKLETSASNSTALLYKLQGTIAGAVPANRTNSVQPSMVNELLTRKLRTRHSALLISADAVLQKIKERQDVALVDVRDEKEYAKFRIPGSIHLPLHTVKTKEFLKKRSVVLIAAGPGDSQLEQECERLRNAGFQASTLDGGLIAWQRRGAPIEGDLLALSELRKISPRTYFEARHDSNWIALNACKSRKDEGSYFIPEAFPLACPTDPKLFLACFKTALGKNNSDSTRLVLIFDDAGKNYERMEKVLPAAGTVNAYFLRGGLEAYQAYLKQQAGMIRARGVAERTARKCPSCQ